MKNRLGLALGLLLALVHAVWSLAVALMPAGTQAFLNWVFILHQLNSPFTLLAFNLTNAIILVVLTFVIGYILGWLLGMLWGLVRRRA